MKTCKSCGKSLPYECFTPSKNVKDGYENKCKSCRQAQRKSKDNKCEGCGKNFKSARSSTKYCSRSCAGKARMDRAVVQCNFCGNDVTVVRHKAEGNNYCSKECSRKYLSSITGEENRSYNRVKTNCSGCKKEIRVVPSLLKNGKRNFCSKECYKKHIGEFIKGELNPGYKRVTCTCFTCNKEFERIPALVGEKNFCSNNCRVGYLVYLSKERVKHRISVKCFNCHKDYTVKPSVFSSRTAFYCSKECQHTHWGKTFNSGENNYNYNGNLTVEDRMKTRSYTEYNAWRKEVYERDNYTCVICKDNKGGNLNAHHLYSYSTYEHLRTDLSNGVTLCNDCHSEFHNRFGYYNNTKEQFEQFSKLQARQS